MALTQKLDNINWSLIFERPKPVEREEKGRRRRRGRGREEEEKRRREEEQTGMDSSMFSMIFGTDLWISCMDSCLWVVGCKKPN